MPVSSRAFRHFGSAVSDASLPLDLSSAPAARLGAHPSARPARRLRHPAPDLARRPAARRRRRLDRRGQVDARQLRRRARGDPARRPAADDPLAGARPPPLRRALVLGPAHPAGPGPHHRSALVVGRPGRGAPRSRRRRSPPGWPCSTPPTSTASSRPTATWPTQLLAAADLWLFVTTAARYADAVPWELLREASERGTSVAVVLDRVPAGGRSRRSARTSRSMLREQGLDQAPIFTVVESELADDGLLPPTRRRAAALGWLAALCRRCAGPRRSSSARPSHGALDSLDARIAGARRRLEDAGRGAAGRSSRRPRRPTPTRRAQVEAGMTRRHAAARRGARAVAGVRRHRRVLPAGRVRPSARVRDRLRRAIKGEPAPAGDLGEALQSGVAALLIRARRRAPRRDLAALAHAARRRRSCSQPHPDLGPRSADLDRRVERARARLAGRRPGPGPRRGQGPRVRRRGSLAYGVNGIGVVLMLVTFAEHGGITGAEVGIAGGIGRPRPEAARGGLR